MKITKVYLDMDGVLCDFDKKFQELYGKDALENRDRKMWTKAWPDFIKNRQFVKLDWFPGAQELLAYLRSKNVHIEILTSSGGMEHHEEVADQKKEWLKNHKIDYKVNVVPGRRYKKAYASPDAILIDDTDDIIDDFNEAGGIGILHKDIRPTMTRLKELFDAEQA